MQAILLCVVTCLSLITSHQYMLISWYMKPVWEHSISCLSRSAILDLLWLQLGNVHLDNEAADMNVSAVALAAVDIAATALDSALLSVERTVERSQQRPEVSKHASPSICAFMHAFCTAVGLLPGFLLILALCHFKTPGHQAKSELVQHEFCLPSLV